MRPVLPTLLRVLTATLLAGIVALPLSTPVAGQLLTIGAKGGATFATVSDADGAFSDVGRRTGSAFGAFVTIGGNPIGLRGEVLLVQKGFDGRQDGDDIQFEVDYVELPVLLVFQLGAGPVQPAVYGGAAVGFERSCTISGSSAGLSVEGDCDEPDFELERESLDVGAVFGAEVMFGLGGASLVVDGRYTVGLTTLDASDDPDEIKNRAFLLMAGVAIPIG